MSMIVNGMQATINTPAKLEGTGIHGLPPYAPCASHNVDDYPACPANWMHGSALAGSYFVPVESERGMWFDFRPNEQHSHDVAIVTSVQGVNPITGPLKPGEPCELRLEQYRDKCPRHGIDFLQNRLCPECNYEWPAQNYLSTTTGLPLWIDGFRTENGEVRQYVLTADCSLGVAAQLLGDKRVWAIGFAFYLSKNAKPPKPESIHINSPLYGSFTGAYKHYMMPQSPDSYMKQATCNTSGLMGMSELPMASANCTSRGVLRTCSFTPPEVEVQNLEIAAGALIQQEVGVDPNELSYWNDTPVAMVYVNYVAKEVADQILAAGKRTNTKNGAFANLNVAN